MPFSEGLARVRVDQRWGFIERGGDFSITPRFGRVIDFRMGLASASLEKRSPDGFINKTGDFAIEPAYQYSGYFSEGLVAVTPVGQRFKHFINLRGERAFEGEYLTADSFQNGLCLVSTLKSIAYIDRQGHTVWEGPFIEGR
jgi:hypothetical protein